MLPPRLHILLASESTDGLIIRRGPSKMVCTLGWDREHDTFTMGQWLKGRIYERRCDLSPNGKYFLYFAMNASRHRKGPTCWTAISKTPWLKAIALYGEEETYLGGGQFLDDKTYQVNQGVFFEVLRETTELRRALPPANTPALPIEQAGKDLFYPITGDLGVYYPRLLRTGWTFLQQVEVSPNVKYDLFEKPFSETWSMLKMACVGSTKEEGKGAHWDEHALSHVKKDVVLNFPDWEWMEKDGNRLVWASKGQLWASHLGKEGLEEAELLRDFNELKFEEIEAPY